MKRSLALLGGIALVASQLLTTGCATATPATTLRLTVKVDLGVGVWERWTLACGPTAGTHPNRTAACKALLAKTGRALLAPVPRDAMCTMIYGGPERATVSGTWNGKRVNASFSRTNGCEIARWEKASALFTVPGKSVVRGAVSLSPTCAVQHVGETCEDSSVAAVVSFTRAGHTVRVRSVADKGFVLRLAPGLWKATADAGRSCPSVDVIVPSSDAVLIPCDTGIR